MAQLEFKNYLRSELIRRCKKNPKYSIRAFAKALEMDASTLAKILNGKRPIGKKATEKITQKLGLSPAEASSYLKNDLNESEEAAYDRMNLDLFDIISDWHHFAILELMTIDSFQPDAKWISRALGISLSEVKEALDRLVRCHMLEIKGDQWIDKSSGRSTNIMPDVTTAALRQLQKQFLQKSIVALEEVPISQRDHTSMTMAIDREKILLAKEKIKTFRRQLAKYLSRSGKRNDVYNLTISLYPLTQIERK
jgi:uncharacterized protein (TIGR02147 family)